MPANARLHIDSRSASSSQSAVPRISRRPLLLRCRLGFHQHGAMRWVGERLFSECSYCGAGLIRDDRGWREIGGAAARHLIAGNRLLVALTRNALVAAACRLLGSGARGC